MFSGRADRERPRTKDPHTGSPIEQHSDVDAEGVDGTGKLTTVGPVRTWLLPDHGVPTRSPSPMPEGSLPGGNSCR